MRIIARRKYQWLEIGVKGIIIKTILEHLILKLPAPINTWVSYAKETWHEYSSDNGSLIAAAISFYDFLSLFPMLLAGIGILGLVIGSPQRAEDMLIGSARGFLAGPQTSTMIRQVIHGSNAATGIGLLVLLWSGTTALVMLEKAINVAWDIEDKRGFFKSRAIALLVLVIAGILVALSIGMTAGISALRNVASARELAWFWNVLGYLIALLISIALFTFVYKVLPYPPVRWKTALTGGILAGILFEIAKYVFTWYVVHFASYNKVYGSLGGVILLLVWINYSAVITILGAEFAGVWAKRHQPAPEQQDKKD